MTSSPLTAADMDTEEALEAEVEEAITLCARATSGGRFAPRWWYQREMPLRIPLGWRRLVPLAY
jgi:hypothetical protein